MNTIKVVVAEDYQTYLTGIVEGLRKQELIEIAGYAVNGIELLKILPATKPDVVLMDIHMPRMNGIDANKQIRCNYPDIRVFALTAYSDKQNIIAMMNAGASGYIYKDTEFEQIAKIIRNVHDGKFRFCGEMDFRLINEICKNQGQPFTVQELKMMHLLCALKSKEEIAAALFVSVSTYTTLRKILFSKVGVKTTEGLIYYAAMHGYDKPPDM